MLRTLAVAVVMLLASAGGLRAAEVVGKIKNVDADKKELTLTVDGADKAYQVPDTAKVVSISGKGKKQSYSAIPGGLKGLTVGNEVTCFTDTDNADRLIEIRVASTKKKKKNK